MAREALAARERNNPAAPRSPPSAGIFSRPAAGNQNSHRPGHRQQRTGIDRPVENAAKKKAPKIHNPSSHTCASRRRPKSAPASASTEQPDGGPKDKLDFDGDARQTQNRSQSVSTFPDKNQGEQKSNPAPPAKAASSRGRQSNG